MPIAKQLSEADIDELGFRASDDGNPAEVAAKLVAAVDTGRVPDPVDRIYALSLAADLNEQAGDLHTALAVAERAVSAAERDEPDNSYPVNLRAILLGKLGRTEEAIAALSALRPRFPTEGELASMVGESLEEIGQTPLAIEWLTATLDEIVPKGELPADPARSADAYFILQQRHRLRENLELPHDDYDHLADQLAEAMEEATAGLPDHYAEIYFPKAELEALYLRFPGIDREVGRNWDDHRAIIEDALAELFEEGTPGLMVAVGSAEGYAAFLEEGDDPRDPELLAEYADSLMDSTIAWPPERNDACWCGSGLKYKKCCRPRQATGR